MGMQVAGIKSLGAPIEAIEVPDPRPLADDEVLIEVRAAGVGNWEEFVRTGDWDIGGTPPMALGVEAAGVVMSVGEEVERWSPGDEVLTHPLPVRDQGSWAPLLIASEAVLASKPSTVSWDAASAFPVPALTAGQMIDDELGVGPDDSVLVHGAGGVTGSVIAGLAAVRGATVIATAGPANHERLGRLGVMHVLDYHDPEWPAQARELAGGGGATAAANAVSDGSADAIRSVRDGGRLVTITGDPPDEERGVTSTALIVEPNGPQLDALAELLGEGRLDIQVAETFDLADAAAALQSALGGHGGGAVVIRP
jgi:NADPH:quinone reductase-like Zn-dependent oxidoreductase